MAGTAIGVASADLAKKDKIIRDDTTKLAKLKTEIALIHTVSGQLTKLLEEGQAAETALDGLLKQWQDMETKLNTVIGSVNGLSPNDGIFLQDELKTANDQWAKTESDVP